MNRRGFLQGLATLTAAVVGTTVLDPGLALWVPGAKTTFDLGATPKGIELCDPFEATFDLSDNFLYPSNRVVSPDWLAKEYARLLTEKLRMAANINRDYSEYFNVEGAKVGSTVQIRLPQRYRA